MISDEPKQKSTKSEKFLLLKQNEYNTQPIF